LVDWGLYLGGLVGDGKVGVMGWIDVSGYEGLYQVSNTGLVRGVSRVKVIVCKDGKVINRPIREVILKQQTLRGYRYVRLSKDGVMSNHLVHRLVAQAFLPIEDGKALEHYKSL